MLTYLLLLLLAGIVATDTTSGPQMLFSEPLVSCSLGGVIIGDPAIGIEIGMMFQLLWIGYMPLGAVRFTDSNMGAIISLASLYTAGDLFSLAGSEYRAAVIPALIVGIAAGLAGSRFRHRVRRFNNRVSETLLSKVERGETPSVTPWHLAGIGASFFRGTLMAVVFIPLGAAACAFTVALPDRVVTGMAWSVPLVWGIACASTVFFSAMKGHKTALATGLAVGVAWVFLRTGGIL